MKCKRRKYQNGDFIKIRDFLQNSFNNQRHNWLIDRWNFCRYFGQIMHGSFDTWPATVGIWEDENREIVAIVNSQGNQLGKNVGDAFIQLSDREFSEEFLTELIDYAEEFLAFKTQEGRTINLRVNREDQQIRQILKERSYSLTEGKDPMAYMDIKDQLKVELPEGFQIIEANKISDYYRGFAHGKAFGYYKSDVPDDDDAKKCYENLKNAPDYSPEIDLVVIDKGGNIAAFTTHWYDSVNKIGILEPVGTLPEFRGLGLARAVIYEGINRVRKKGAKQVYVGSSQQFYKSIGFSILYEKEIWSKDISLTR